MRALILTVVITLIAVTALAQLRQGSKLPSGPPKYYLRDGSPQWICASYLADGKPAWSCAASEEVAKFILKTPPACP